MAADIEQDGLELSFLWEEGDADAMTALKGGGDEPRPSPWAALSGTLSAYGLTLALIWALIPHARPVSAMLAATGAGIGVFVYTVWRWIAQLARNRRRTARSPYAGWNHVSLSRRGIVWASDTHQEYVSWLGVETLRADPANGLWLGRGGTRGLFVPARVFGDPSAAAGAMRLVQRLQAERTAPVHLVAKAAPEEGEAPIVLH